MNVDLMRKVDYWVGSPFCFKLSILRKLNPFKRKLKGKPKKILFMQISEMGSTIMVYSAIKRIKKMYPNAEIYYLIFKEMQDSVHLLSLVPKENVITISGKNIRTILSETLKAIKRLRKERFDVVFDLELFSRYSACLSYLSGAPVRVGFHRFHMEGLYRGNLLTHKVQYNTLSHVSLNFMSLVEALETEDIPMTKKSYNSYKIERCMLTSTKEQKESIWKKLKQINKNINQNKKIVIVNANASALLPLRIWPIEKYIEVIKRLLKDKDVYIVLIGVDSEKPEGERICRSVKNDRCISLVGKTTLRELVDLFNISDALLSNDSGPPHFASTTNIKIMVFFGPESPAIYCPLGPNVHVFHSNFACSPCVSAYNHRKSPCKDNKCLQAIEVDKVYNAVMSCLKSK